MKLYLDTCCLNRPLDDKSQALVAVEAEAVLAILLFKKAPSQNDLSVAVRTPLELVQEIIQ